MFVGEIDLPSGKMHSQASVVQFFAFPFPGSMGNSGMSFLYCL
jgi:hypothetical protein